MFIAHIHLQAIARLAPSRCSLPAPQWTDAIVKILFISSHCSDILAFLCVSFQLKNNILPLLIFSQAKN